MKLLIIVAMMASMDIFAVTIDIMETSMIDLNHYKSSSKVVHHLNHDEIKPIDVEFLKVRCGSRISKSGSQHLGLLKGETAIINNGEVLVTCRI